MVTLPVLAEILGPDILVIIAIIAVLFGGSQVPKLARSLGSAKREFEKGIAGEDTADAPPGDQVTMTRAQLDDLLAEREQAARESGQHEQPRRADD